MQPLEIKSHKHTHAHYIYMHTERCTHTHTRQHTHTKKTHTHYTCACTYEPTRSKTASNYMLTFTFSYENMSDMEKDIGRKALYFLSPLSEHILL